MERDGRDPFIAAFAGYGQRKPFHSWENGSVADWFAYMAGSADLQQMPH
jgi:hypothetical protein